MSVIPADDAPAVLGPARVAVSWKRLVLDLGARAGRAGLGVLGAVALIVVIWTAFLHLVDVSPFVAKSPADVWSYLVTEPGAADHRAGIASDLARTASDASLGFALGLTLAMATSMTFYFMPAAEAMLVPAVAALRAVPMVTLAPILVLTFGRGTAGTAVIGAAIVFTPALFLMLQGIHSAPRAQLDLCESIGGSTWFRFTKVAIPHAVPTWFAAARISVTTSVVGALLAEWLASGRGLGGQMLRDANQFEFARLWSSVVVLTVACVAAYQIVSAVESAAFTRMHRGS